MACLLLMRNCSHTIGANVLRQWLLANASHFVCIGKVRSELRGACNRSAQKAANRLILKMQIKILENNMSGLKVLEKANLGKLELRNRLVVPPMVLLLADENGFITDDYVKYAETRAEGGWGLFILEATYVDKLGKGFSRGVGIDNDDKIPGLKKMVDAVHAKGGKIAVQLHHAGRETSSAVTGSTVVAPSDCPVCYSNEPVHVLDKEEIQAIVKRFAEGARRAREAGFDAVMIHGAHGYLLTEFLSPYTNKRTDEYGGSLENRLRISLEVIDAIRKEVGPDFPVTYRLSVEEGLPGSLTLQEGAEAAAILAKSGIDALHVVAGNYGSNELVAAPYFSGSMANKARLQAIREAVGPEFPLAVAGRITDVYQAESLIQEGLAQFVAMGRASLADPELPKRSMAGRMNTVRSCLGCNDGCLGRTKFNKTGGCVVNPLTGNEHRFAMPDAGNDPKKILVIGGGPAGMEAAWIAARKGHKVTLCEKEEKLGGQFLLAAYPPMKNGIFTYLSHMQNRLLEENVELRLGCAADADLIRSEKPDFVFLATGGVPITINFPGLESIHWDTSHNVLRDSLETLGQKVAVIGGGMVGLETAEFIALSGRQVDVIEMLPEAAPSLYFTVRAELLKRLASLGVRIHTSHKVVGIRDGMIMCEADGKRTEIGPVDSVVLALGAKSEASLESALKDLGVEYTKIGDCQSPGDCFQATHSALKACKV